MPTSHVRNVPEDLYERLRERARRQNRSISAEVIVLLSRALAEVRENQVEILNNIRRRRFFRPAAVGAPDSITLLHEDRRR